MKLQDAYAAETGAVGNWAIIGYIAPGTKTAASGNAGASSQTTAFTYTDKFAAANANTTLVGAVGATAVNAWSATNNTALNDCPVNSEWTVKMKTGSASSNGSPIEYVAATPDGKDTECKPLTANFANIGK